MKQKVVIISSFLCIVVILFYLRNSNIYKNEFSNKINKSKISELSKTFFKSKTLINKKKIFLFIDYYDFSCPPCEASVVNTLKLLTSKTDKDTEKRVLILINNRKIMQEFNKQLTYKLKNEIEFNFKLIYDNLRIFEELKIEKSSLLLLDKKNKILGYFEYPIIHEELVSIIEEFLENSD